MIHLKYKNVNREFILNFPEFIGSYNYFFVDNEVTEEEYQYVLYEGLIAHVVDILLKMKKNQKRDLLLERLFTYMEKMMTATDDDVVNLAYIAFFEYRDRTWFSKASSYMSSNLRAILSAEFSAWQQNNSDESENEFKYIFSDLYGIRSDIFKIFKEDGLSMNDIPEITSSK